MTVALYRHFDSSGTLLYVGISLSAVQRLSDHARESCWAKSIAHVTVEWFDTRGGALSAEAQAIRSENPQHNKAHNAAVRFGRLAPGRRRAPPEVPQLVYQPEAVAFFFNVGVGVVRNMVAQGMPRKKISARKYEYDLAAIKAWTKERAAMHAESLRQKREADNAVMQTKMRDALAMIGRKQ